MADGHASPDEATDPDERLGAGAAAQMLGVHIDTVRRWADSGYLPASKVGPAGFRRFRRGDLDALRAKHRQTPAPRVAFDGTTSNAEASA